jgi:hypothetical protein
MSEYQLTEKIIALSVAKTWDKAKLEWGLLDVYWEKEPDTCLCGHYPINEICILRNNKNGEQAIVGNCCVKKFTGLPSDKIFQALKKIHRNIEKALNAETIEHAHQKRWINDWEYDFYFDTMRKRNLSKKQMDKRIQINKKILNRIKNQLKKG